MKKKTLILSCIGAVVLLSGGTAFGVNRYQYSKNIIDVVPVEMLNSDWSMDEGGSNGTVTNSMSQEVIPDDDNTVKKIYVKEGQKVKIGDKLVAYDMAKKKLEMELKGYDVKAIEFSIQRAEKELADLKKGIVSGSGSSGSDSSVGRKDPLLASLFLRSSDTETSGSEAQPEVTTSKEAAETEKSTTAESTTAKTTEADTPTTTETPNTTEKPATTEKPTTTEKPAATTEAPDNDWEANVYSELTSSSIAYKGDGTADSPYRYLCTSDCKIKGSFINMIRGYNANGSKKTGSSLVVILEVRQENKPWGSLIKSLTLYGSKETKKNQNSSWSLDSYISGQEDEDPDSSASTDDGGIDDVPDDGGSGGSSGGNSGDSDISYTKEEIQDMIKEKENDLADLKLDLKEAQLEYDTMKKEISDGTVTAVINGVVKEVNDPEDAASEGTAVVTVSSEGSLYVRGAVDEFSYESLKEGAVITADSWETGNSFQAKVTEISPYPASDGSYYSNGSGNPNVSYYPFTAIIEDPPEDISTGESVTINFNKNEQIDTEGSIYLPLAYVRSENGKSYVYLRGKDKKLKKQYVTTGQTLYNYVIEIKGGLKVSDSVAFPYGKTVKEGAKTKIADDDAEIYY